MLGGTGAGKSSITSKYTKGNFNKQYEPTVVEHQYKPNVQIRGGKYSVEVIDTCGESDMFLLERWI